MTDGKRLENKVAMITGGASGIGAASARLFAEHGAAVVIADINDNLGPKVVGEIESEGGSALYIHLDASSEDEWREAMAAVDERFGRLDIMLNGAGVSGRLPDGSAAPRVGDANLENWDRIMSVNATGVFLGTKYAIEPMLKAGGGSIINISSIYGIVGSEHNAAYHASKGGGAHVLQVGRRPVRDGGDPGELGAPRLRRLPDDPGDPRQPGARRASPRPDPDGSLRAADRHRQRVFVPRLRRVPVDDRRGARDRRRDDRRLRRPGGVVAERQYDFIVVGAGELAHSSSCRDTAARS